MIYLEHINLVVPDLPTMLKFYQAAFPHWKIRDQGESDWYGKPLHWIHFGDDYQYIAMSDHGDAANRNLEGHSIGLAHFAYVVDNLQAVIKRLKSAGFEVGSEGADSKYRNNIYFIDPAGFEIEFVEYLSDLPLLRNS